MVGGKRTYPCEIELGLYTDHITFLLVLCPQNLQFCGIEGRFRIDGIYDCKSVSDKVHVRRKRIIRACRAFASEPL